MYGNPQRRTSTEVQELRRDGGRWLKELREKAGVSQRELAAAVGAEYYTFISQLETGRGRIPPDRYVITSHCASSSASFSGSGIISRSMRISFAAHPASAQPKRARTPIAFDSFTVDFCASCGENSFNPSRCFPRSRSLAATTRTSSTKRKARSRSRPFRRRFHRPPLRIRMRV